MSDIEYDYTSKIKHHKDLGVKDDGSNSSIKKCAKVFNHYLDALRVGDSNAVQDNSALGNRYFEETGAYCTDYSTNHSETLYTFFDNVPSGAGADGLVTGIEQHLKDIDVSTLSTIYDGSLNVCKEITCTTRDNDHNEVEETKHVTETEYEVLQTNDACKDTESFSNLKQVSSKLPKDPYIKGYYTVLSFLGLYVVYNCITNKK